MQSNARTDKNSDIWSNQTKTKIQIKNTALPKNYQETEPELIPSPPPTSSLRKYCILPRSNTIFHSQNLKNLQGASADNRGVTKFELKEVIHLIQNTMQTLTILEKFFSKQ